MEANPSSGPCGAGACGEAGTTVSFPPHPTPGVESHQGSSAPRKSRAPAEQRSQCWFGNQNCCYSRFAFGLLPVVPALSGRRSWLRLQGSGPVSLTGRSLFDLSVEPWAPLASQPPRDAAFSLSRAKWRIGKCYLRKHMFSPLKAAPPLPPHTNTFLYSTQTSPRGICNNCGDKSARR